MTSNKYLNQTYILIKTEIEAPQTLQETIKGQTSTFNILKKQIGLKPLMHAFENFQ